MVWTKKVHFLYILWSGVSPSWTQFLILDASKSPFHPIFIITIIQEPCIQYKAERGLWSLRNSETMCLHFLSWSPLDVYLCTVYLHISIKQHHQLLIHGELCLATEEMACSLMVRKFQNEKMKSSHCPKYERKNLKNSALKFRAEFWNFLTFSTQWDKFFSNLYLRSLTALKTAC